MVPILPDYIYAFCLDNSNLLVVLGLLVIFALDFYTRYYKINLDTDNVDLMYRYMWLKLHRKYRHGTTKI
jgi:hypothetical protein